MPLSEHEQRMLDQLEEQLAKEDPKFVNAMQATSRSWSIGRVLGGIVIVLVGLGVLIGGVATKLLILGILGFVLMVGGAWLAFSTSRKPGAPEAQSKSVGEATTKKSFTSKFEERWEKRQQDGWDQR
ncbi:DUF3040 domain-containing protein [Micrococcales bacterium 31B]|nr:DUF3040 domain-containing protein [Micrococcales bacterium 31B]